MEAKDLVTRLEEYADCYKEGRNLGREVEGTDDLLVEAANIIKRQNEVLTKLASIQISDDPLRMQKVIRISYDKILTGPSVVDIISYHLSELGAEIDRERKASASKRNWWLDPPPGL